MRIPWTKDELADLRLPWDQFQSRHPDRSYDSYEVKRRRVGGGSAGRGRVEKNHVHSVRCHCKPFLFHFPDGVTATLPRG